MASNLLPHPELANAVTTGTARAIAEHATAPIPTSGPWANYAEQPAPEAGPWQKYGGATGAAPAADQASFSDRHPILSIPWNIAGGIESGIQSTVYHGGDLIRRAVGMPSIIDNPEVQKRMTAPEGIAGSVGKFGEQAAEFAAPMGAVSKATRGMSLLMRMAAEGLTGGTVAALQSGGDPAATVGGAMGGAAGPVAGAGVGAIGRTGAPEKLYQSALKPTWAMVRKEGLGMVDTGLKEGIPVNQKGLQIVEDKINALRSEISKGIQARAAQGREVDTSKVLATLDDLKNFYENTGAPKYGLNTIKALKKEFTQFHGQKIPLDKAQQIKINTYQLLKNSYGEMAGAKVEGLKQIARGLKEQISAVFPEIAGLNEQQSKLLGLDEALTRALWRIENHQMMGIGSPLAAAGGHALLGGPGAAAGFVSKMLLDDPGLKSKLAIALARAGVQGAKGVVDGRLAALQGTIAKIASGLTESGGQPTLQPAHP